MPLDTVTSLASKNSILEALLKDTAKQEGQTTQPSNDQSSSNTPHIPPLFPLAMLQTETHNYTAAISFYRTLLSADLANLAAVSNLIYILNL
jgi:hypothetical protein